MGRVRRYKKIKAIDPFSNRSKKETNTNHDEPPELFDKKEKKKRKRKTTNELDWDNEDDREILLQQQAYRDMNTNKSTTTFAKQPVITSKLKPGESLNKFKKRVREETKQILAKEIPKLTQSAKRRKEKLKDIKQKRKEKKLKQNGDESDDDINPFGSRSDGFIRPSDRGDVKPYFDSDANVKFGERVERPPDLQEWAAKLVAKSQKKPIQLQLLDQLKLSSTSSVLSTNNKDIQKYQKEEVHDNEDEDDDEYEEQPKKKKSKKMKMSERHDLDGDEHYTGDSSLFYINRPSMSSMSSSSLMNSHEHSSTNSTSTKKKTSKWKL